VPVVRFDSGKMESLGWRCQRGSAAAMRAALGAMRDELDAIHG
jgi:hypothetical protein